MSEREITLEEVRVGDEVKIYVFSYGVLVSYQGKVTSKKGDVVFLGDGVNFSYRTLQGWKVTLINRPPQEVCITAKDVKPGMLIKCDNAVREVTEVGRMVNLHFKDENTWGSIYLNDNCEVTQVIKE